MKIQFNKILAILIGLFFSGLAWSPSLIRLSQLTGDQTFEELVIQASCSKDLFSLGWYVGDSSEGLGIFSPSLSGYFLNSASCSISRTAGINHVQAALTLGISVTFILAYISCQINGFLPISSSIGAFLITTAPCAFSRIGHIWLTALWPVLPGLTACYILWKIMIQKVSLEDNSIHIDKDLSGGNTFFKPVKYGLILSVLCLPMQEYYVFFTLLILATCFIIFLILASTLRRSLKEVVPDAIRGLQFGLGFGVVILITFSPKIAMLFSVGVPIDWSTPRYASEQFVYGLLPLTWLVPSPFINHVTDTLQSQGIRTASESYFWSAGSSIIPVSWAMGIRCLGSISLCNSRETKQYVNSGKAKIFYSLLLFIVTFVGLLGMTMGGVGTLFAAYITPVFRSLNRFTVFVYGASLLLILSYFDAWIRNHKYADGKAK